METTGARVLVVDDDSASRRLLEVRLRPLECAVATASNGEQALGAIRKDLPDLVLLDLQMPRMGGIEVLRALRNEGIDIPTIVITAHGSIETAVEAMKEGAYDFITKPIDAKHFDIVVRKVLEREGLKRGLELLTEETDNRYRLIIGQSKKMAEAADVAQKAAASNATVLLLGESGTGKEIFARAIHNWSERKNQPFVAINCVGLSKELLESELFGHEKGAFTGADQLKKGKMELANGGTVFLDEIGDVSQELQTKLLRFLQEREFDRVGGRSSIRVDVRIVAATNRDLEGAVREGWFREGYSDHFTAVAGTGRGYSRPLATFPTPLCRRVKKGVSGDNVGGDGEAFGIQLAGERARACQRYRARGGAWPGTSDFDYRLARPHRWRADGCGCKGQLLPRSDGGCAA